MSLNDCIKLQERGGFLPPAGLHSHHRAREQPCWSPNPNWGFSSLSVFPVGMDGGGENPVLKIPKHYSAEIRPSSLEILVILSEVFVIILWPLLALALCPSSAPKRSGRSWWQHIWEALTMIILSMHFTVFVSLRGPYKPVLFSVASHCYWHSPEW